MERSENIGALAAALAKAQGAMAAAKETASNPYFKTKYADLAAIVEAIKAPLSINELAYVQGTDMDEAGAIFVETVLMHSSGEWLSSRLRIKPAKEDAQSIGAALSYGRRYALQALVGVPSDDESAAPPTQEDERETAIYQPPKAASKRFHTAQPETAPTDEQQDMDIAAEIARFKADVAASKVGGWKFEAKGSAAQALAVNIKGRGLTEHQRKCLYLALTGKESGKEFTEAELVTLTNWANKAPEVLKAIAEAEAADGTLPTLAALA